MNINFESLKKIKFSIKNLLILAFVFAGTLGVGFVSGDNKDYTFDISKNLDIFGKVLREVNLNYVDDVDPNQFVKIGIDAMLKSLDPYTNYITASEIEDYQYMSTGQYGGVGASVATIEKKTVITEVFEDKPAFKAGLRTGDVIIKIDNETIEGKDFDNADVRNLLRGQPKTNVVVVVKRFSVPEPLSFTVVRDEIKVDNVPYSGYVADGIGYISLNQFTRDATAEVKKAYEEIKSKNPNLQGLILDLRGNPGGLLHEAVNISNLFVKQGEKIVETKGKMEGSYKRYDAENPPLDEKIPLTVLVNGNSASASEIVSGVMQDLDRGVVVGRRSYGKGLVQTTRQLSYKTQMKITTAKYYTPSGRCIQAIDYANKDKDGKAIKTADSLQHEFRTRNKRPVKDAAGVNPDVIVESPEYHKLTGDLIRQNIIFDFATEYYYNHKTIPSVKDFKITDEIYNEFIAYTQKRNFSSESKFNKDLDALNKSLEKETYYTNIKSQFENFKKMIDEQRKNDVISHRQEIAAVIRTEIISRYYHRKGRIETSFEEDNDVKEAIKVLRDLPRYRSILAGK